MFLLIASTLLVLTIALGYKFLKNKYSYWEKRGIPYEQPKWPVGNLQGIGRTLHFYELNQRIYQRFKNIAPFAGMYYYLRRVAFIMDLDLVKHVLIKDFASFHDRGLYSNVKDDPLTGHLITLEGAEWRAMRQKLTPVFTANRMRFMFPTVVAVAENLAQECGRLAALNIEGDVEFKDLSARYTTDVIGTCAFGLECNSLQDPNAEFRRRDRDFFENPRLSKFGRIFITSNPRLARKLGMKIFPDSVSSFFLQSVRDTIDYRQRHGIKRNDFMDLMIELKARDEAAVQANNGIDLSQGLTLEQIAAQAFVFFIAGFDTSATTMSFCLYELAKNQEVQDRLRSEIRQVLADHNNRLTYDALIAMSYLDQVFDETLRLHPTAASLIRKTTVDYQLPDSPHVLEKGTTVIIPVDAIHHDPELYPSPELFQPERFTKAAKDERHPCAYLPFGDGPRNCIGLRFGKMQSKIGLVLLLKDYKVSRSSLTEDPIEIAKNQLVITAKNGVHLRVERV